MTIDADLQHLPEEIPLFIDSGWKADIYMGTRDLRSADMPIHRRLTNYLTSLIISIFSRQRIRDSQSGYRMLSTDVLRKLKIRSLKYDFESELLFQAGMLDINVAEVRISTVYEGSHSYINPLVDTLRFIKLIWRRIVL
ncbi:MAG: glycosyltransferase family 2 protein [Candidatus Zixiibacteriota bacterium]|nr:MAG: glycosyltransferase family 2 protein [candidate division Zixibacteria bacterium]